MKYRVNERSDYTMLPVMELEPGKEGVITWVEIRDDCSAIHTLDKTIYPGVLVRQGNQGHNKSMLLSKCDDEKLDYLSTQHGLPREELEELRDLEKQYRESRAKPGTAAPS